jgi:hypothetical protein
MPYLPFMALLGFVPLPVSLLGTLAAIAVLYVAATEIGKEWFYRRVA